MSLKRLASLAVLTAISSLGSAPASAQGIETIVSPAEMPPLSYSGQQFVDSTGCVFIRAGFDGAVIWVPRVTRDRKQVCGFAPTFGGSQVAEAAPAAEPAPAPAPVAAPAPAPAPAPVVAAPAPAPAPRPAPVVRTTRGPIETVASIQAAPAPVVKAPASKPPSAPPPALVVRQVPPQPGYPLPADMKCPPGETGTVRIEGVLVRCGPQDSPFVTTVAGGTPPASDVVAYYPLPPAGPVREVAPATVSRNARIVPKAVWNQRDTSHPKVPAGYRPAWTDDRLNPYRGWQTIEGYYDTQRIWTNTLPRRAVVGSPKLRDPILIYPGNPKLRTTVISSSGSAAAAPAREPVVSTRSEPQAKAPAAARYVEVGAFTTGAKADAAAARLRAAGLPVRFGSLNRDGEALKLVRVGPFGSQDALASALRRVQGTGYVNAYLR